MKNNVVNIGVQKWSPLAGGGEPPHDEGVEHRVTALETRLDTILPTLATKADIGELRGDMHKNDASIKGWMIATVISLFLGFAGLFFAISNSLHQGQSPNSPTVIQVPYPAQPVQTQTPSSDSEHGN